MSLSAAAAASRESYSNLVRFGGEFELDLLAYELRRAGTPLKLARIPMELLLLLIERRGQLVTREQIVNRVWGKNVFLDTDNSINAVIRRIRLSLEDDAENPRFIQTVVGRGYRFIASVEDNDPTAHLLPQSKPELPGLLVPEETSSELGAADAVPSVRAKWWVAAGIALILVVMITFGFGRIRGHLFRDTVSAGSDGPVKLRRSIAVLGFKNLSGNDSEAWISTALQEMFSSELAAGQQVRVVSAEDVARMKTDLSLPATDTYSADTLGHIRSHLHADVVVLGSYLLAGSNGDRKIRIDLQLQETGGGETIGVVSANGATSDLADIVTRSGATLRQELGIGAVSNSEALQVLTSMPSSPEAARLYAEGLVKLRIYDAQAACDLLEKAVASDPNHALSHSALAESWSILGYDAKAQSESKKALDLSAPLSREERLSIEGRYRELSHDLPAAIEIYRTLRNFFPDNLDYALRLASSQTSGGHPRDAQETLARIRNLPKPLSEDVRIDLAEMTAAIAASDFRDAQRIGSAAFAKAEKEGSRMFLAQARSGEAWAWDRLGDLAKAQKEMIEARDFAAAAGNPRLYGRMLRGLGVVFYDQGNFASARSAFEECLNTFRKVGAMDQVAVASETLGNIFYDQSKLEEAKRYYEEALRIDREIAANPAEIASDVGSIANVLDSMGDLAGATRMQEESLQGFREAGDKRGECTTLSNLGNVLVERGELGEALPRYDQAIAVAQKIGYKSGHSGGLNSSADIFLARNQIQEARSRAEQGLSLRQQIGDPVKIAESQLELANIALEEGKLAQAESLGRAASPRFEEQTMSANASQSAAVLARILLAQSRISDAKAAADRAVSLAHNTSDRSTHLAAMLAVAEVNMHMGKVSDSGRALNSVLEEATRDGYVGFQFEARLHLAMLEIQSGSFRSARARLTRLQTDSRQKNFFLIDRKASAALRSLSTMARN